MQSLTDRLREKLETMPPERPFLSPLAERLADLLRERGTRSVAEAAAATDSSRNTIKDKFGELVAAGVAELRGKGRAAHYRPARHRCLSTRCGKGLLQDCQESLS